MIRGIGDEIDKVFKIGCGVIIGLALTVIGLITYIVVR